MTAPDENGSAGQPAADERGQARQVTWTVGVIVVLVLMMAFYFLLLGREAMDMIHDGRPAFLGFGIGLLLLPLVGVWVVYSTLRAALAHQRLARRMHEEGGELDTSGLPRNARGRIDHDAAVALFEEVKAEWEADPDNWRTNYRAARAYDYAGDRTRARETMRRAVELERAERGKG